MTTQALPTATVLPEAPRQKVDVSRKDALDDIHNQLIGGVRFVALRGGNGSGKSHFLKNQLVKYYQDELKWRVAFFTPQINPVGALATALAKPGVLLPSQELQPDFHKRLEKQFRDNPEGLVSEYKKAAEAGGEDFKLLIVVDQLEEMFRVEDGLLKAGADWKGGVNAFPHEGDDAVFFSLFLRVHREDVPVFVIFSIGNEKLDRLNAFSGWPEITSQNYYNLPVIKREAMGKALFDEPPFLPATSPLRQLYDNILNHYAALRKQAEKTPDNRADEAAARVNITLELLHQQDVWLKTDPLSSEGTEHYEWLTAYYQTIGGLQGAAAYFYEKIFNERITEENRLPTERLFRAITRKDPSPDRVVAGYAVTWGYLRQVCFRDEHITAEKLKSLDEQAPADPLPTEPSGDENKRLLEIVKAFIFTEQPIPDLIRLIDPQGGSVLEEKVIKDSVIVTISGTGLVQEWPRLTEWVELEYAASALYGKLVDDAKTHFREAVEKKQDHIIELSPFKDEDPDEPSMFQDVWNLITGGLTKLWSGPSKNGTSAAESEQTKTLLSEGAVELVEKRWLETILPTQAWSSKYYFISVFPPGEGAGDTKFRAWIEEEKLKAFSLVLAFWKKSKVHHDNMRKQEDYISKRYLSSQRNIARAAMYLFVFAACLAVYSIVLKVKADNVKNNLSLLSFVDNLAKANLIPDNTYRSDKFRELKETIEESNKIKDNQAVVAFLAGADVLHLRQGSATAPYGVISTQALFLLDALINNYHNRDKQPIEVVSSAVLRVADSVKAFNEESSGINYQFPYVYHTLGENLDLLKDLAAGKDSYGQDSVHLTHAHISAVESNPAVPSQFAVGESTGAVTIYLAAGEKVAAESVGAGISSMAYSRTGEQLYVSTFAGELFRYESLASSINPQAPLGRTNPLRPEKLRVRWPRERPAGLAILSVHATAREDCLLVLGDVALTLIQRTSQGDYLVRENFNLGDDLTSVTLVEGNYDRTIFIVGGSDASELITFHPEQEGVPYIRRERTVVHPRLSVSAIAFEPPAASRGRAPEKQRIAFGTETGDIWLSEVGSMTVTGEEQTRLQNILNNRGGQDRDAKNNLRNYQESAVTRLHFNSTGKEETGNQQLISSSLDGTVWLFNLDVIPAVANQFLERGPNSGDYDHIRLFSSGRSVDDICLLNPRQVLAVENNLVRSWATSISALREETESVLRKLPKSLRDD